MQNEARCYDGGCCEHFSGRRNWVRFEKRTGVRSHFATEEGANWVWLEGFLSGFECARESRHSAGFDAGRNWGVLPHGQEGDDPPSPRLRRTSAGAPLGLRGG